MTIQLDTVVLPDDLYWSDEFESQSVSQTVRRTLAGSVVVYHSEKTNGRLITLESSDDTAWVKRSVVNSIAALAAIPGGQFTLIIRGEVFTVIFRHNEDSAFNARPVVHYSDTDDDDFFTVSIKLMTV